MLNKKGITIIAALLLVAAFSGLFILKEYNLLAFDQPVSVNTQVAVKIYDTSGGLNTKTWGMVNYAECGYSSPGYAFAPGNVLVDTCGNNIPNVQSRICAGNAYKFPRDVYFKPGVIGSGTFSSNKPLQHPTCVAELRDIAQKFNINVTKVVYLDDSNTVVKEVFTSDTIYRCADGTRQIDRSLCESPVVVSSPENVFDKIISWLKGIFTR